MSIPTIVETVGGYTFTWAKERLTIAVNRVRVHTSDGRVTGEVLITTDTPGYSPILYPQSSLNFSASRSRHELVNSLVSSYPDWQWAGIIDQVAFHVQERARLGEPVQEIWTSTEISPPEFLLEPILYKGLPTIVFGEKAVCKSLLALAFYACLLLPWTDNPLGVVAPPRSVSTLLLDWEADPDIAAYNAHRLQRGMELPPFPLYYRRCALPLADDVTQIEHHVQAVHAEAVIVDSLGPAAGGDLKEPGQALRFTAALRQLKVAALIVGQTSKEVDSKDARKSVYGSTFFEYYARNIFHLRKVQEEGEDSLDLALFNTYCNLGKRHNPLGIHLNFNENGIHLQRQDVRTVAEFVHLLGTGARILIYLRDANRPVNSTDLAQALDLSQGATAMALKRLKDKGRIVKVGNEWGLSLL